MEFSEPWFGSRGFSRTDTIPTRSRTLGPSASGSNEFSLAHHRGQNNPTPLFLGCPPRSETALLFPPPSAQLPCQPLYKSHPILLQYQKQKAVLKATAVRSPLPVMSLILPCPPCLLHAGGGGFPGSRRGSGWGRGIEGGGGGRGYFIHLGIYCTTTWCFALKGLRTMKRLGSLSMNLFQSTGFKFCSFLSRTSPPKTLTLLTAPYDSNSRRSFDSLVS